MLERSKAAKSAISVFFEEYNEIDVYVEDTAKGYEKLFARLLGRALTVHVALERVYPLGSRKEVLAEAEKLECSTDKRTSVFIVDGDLYLLAGERDVISKNVVVLPRYCIENFLFDESALLQIIDEENIDKDVKQLEAQFDFENWLSEASENLKELFVIFAVSHALESGIPTVSRGGKSICADNLGNICRAKVERTRVEIYEELCGQFGKVKVDEFIEFIERRIASDCCFTRTYVSGKDFIFPLLYARVRTVAGSDISKINFKHRLASNCDPEALFEIAAKVQDVLKWAETR